MRRLFDCLNPAAGFGPRSDEEEVWRGSSYNAFPDGEPWRHAVFDGGTGPPEGWGLTRFLDGLGPAIISFGPHEQGRNPPVGGPRLTSESRRP